MTFLFTYTRWAMNKYGKLTQTLGPKPCRTSLFICKASVVVGVCCLKTIDGFFFRPVDDASNMTDTRSFSLPAHLTQTVLVPLSSIVFLGSISKLTGVWSAFQISTTPISLAFFCTCSPNSWANCSESSGAVCPWLLFVREDSLNRLLKLASHVLLALKPFRDSYSSDSSLEIESEWRNEEWNKMKTITKHTWPSWSPWS